jgi:hypothetical protein
MVGLHISLGSGITKAPGLQQARQLPTAQMSMVDLVELDAALCQRLGGITLVPCVTLDQLDDVLRNMIRSFPSSSNMLTGAVILQAEQTAPDEA